MSNLVENGVKVVGSDAINPKSDGKESTMDEKSVNVAEMVSEVAKNILNGDKTEVKVDKKVVKKVKVESKPAEKSQKGGDKMGDRTHAISVVTKVCREIGGIAMNRVQARADAKGEGAIQIRRADGLKASIRTGDVMLLSPYEVVKIGKPHGGGYPHITLVRFSDVKLEEAVRRCLKDKKSNLAWAAELKASRRTKTVEDLAAKKARLMAEMKAIADLEKSMKAKAARLKRVKPDAKVEAVEPVVA